MIISSALISISPAISAPENAELLNSYIGEWKGSGKLNRANNTETIRCKLSVTPAKGSKINYKGKCAVAGANFSIAGTMAYFKEKKRYEAVMSSSTSFSGVAIGERQKDSIDFQLKDRNSETGDRFEIKSNIELSEEVIGIDFSVVNLTTKKVISTIIPFSK